MPLSRTFRNVCVLVVVVAALVATQTRVLAVWYSNLQTFQSNWYPNYDCSASFNQGYPPGWAASGDCDFSAYENYEELGAAYCLESGMACDSDCNDNYDDYIANWYQTYGSPYDPCYSAYTGPWCWVTWPRGSCSAGEYSDWDCACEAFFFCECDR